jgi:predicted transcriptional regulator
VIVSTVNVSAIVSDRLKEIAEKVKNGTPVEVTVRALLSWVGAHRRSWRNVAWIRDGLKQARLITIPDFEEQYIDGTVTFRVLPPVPQVPALYPVKLPDPAHRISRLESANRPPVRVSPNAAVQEAVTVMLCHDYSQLPVMQSDREVKGIFSWKSYGSRLAAGRQCACVQDGMDNHQEIPSNASLFDAVRIVAEHDCVLIRASDKRICGIVTAYDISRQFGDLAEPFLLLGDIENHIRYLIGSVFTVGELQQIKAPEDSDREVQDASDLTFGEYVRLLQNEQNWRKLKIGMDQKTFTSKLDKVRVVRNDVMHFEPDPLDADDLQLLRDFAHFLARWQQITS